MRSAFVVSLLISLSLAGCAGNSTPSDSGDPGGSTAPSDGGGNGGGGGDGSGGDGEVGDGVEYSEGSDGSYACAAPGSTVKADPNRTYEGSAHQHDMWGGQKELVIFDKKVTPVGGGWMSTEDAVVLTGTGRVDFRLSWTDAATPTTRTLMWDMPGDDKGQAAMYSQVFSKSGENHSFAINISNNDPPHYSRSTWDFKVTGGDIHFAWTIYRTYDCLPIDPPHYDFWAGAKEKFLSLTTIVVKEEMVAVCGPVDPCAGLRQPGSGTFWMDGPNTSVPPGSTRVEVVISWTNDLPSPNKIRIEYQTASTDGGSTTAAAYWKRPTGTPRQVSATSQAFDVTVGPEDWDSPYDLKSAWRFKWFFDSTSTNAALTDTGAFKGTIKFEFKAFRD